MWRAGCKAAGDDLGVDVVVVGPGAESDIDGSGFHDRAADRRWLDAIVCAPNDAGAAQGALQAAIDAGIPVLAVDTNVGIAGQTSFCGTSNVDAAYEGGKWAIEQAGTDAKAVIIYGQEGDNTSNMRMEGYEKGLNRGWRGSSGQAVRQQPDRRRYQGHGRPAERLSDQIDIVLAHNDDTAIGAMNACKSAALSVHHHRWFCDGNASAVKLILDGELVKLPSLSSPYEMGYQVVEAAVKAVKLEPVDEVINRSRSGRYAENGQAYLDNLEAMKG